MKKIAITQKSLAHEMGVKLPKKKPKKPTSAQEIQMYEESEEEDGE